MLHVSLVPDMDNRSSSVSKDAKLVNGYADIIDKQKEYVVKRPGHDAGTLYEAGAIQGVTTYLDVPRLVVNNKFFYNSTTSLAVNTTGLRVDFA